VERARPYRPKQIMAGEMRRLAEILTDIYEAIPRITG
jgi:hypothetical protein